MENEQLIITIIVIAVVHLLMILGLFYVSFAILLQTIAKKQKREDSWKAWVPLLNIVLMTELSDNTWKEKFGKHAGWKIIGITVMLNIGIMIPIVGAICGVAATAFQVFQLYYFFKPYTKDAGIVTVLTLFVPFYLLFKSLILTGELKHQQISE